MTDQKTMNVPAYEGHRCVECLKPATKNVTTTIKNAKYGNISVQRNTCCDDCQVKLQERHEKGNGVNDTHFKHEVEALPKAIN